LTNGGGDNEGQAKPITTEEAESVEITPNMRQNNHITKGMGQEARKRTGGPCFVN